MRAEVTLAEIAALLAAAQDHALGQPPGCQLRAVVLGQRLAGAAGADAAERATTWWASAFLFLGCMGHAFDMAVVSHAGAGQSGAARLRSVLSVLAGGKKAAEVNFRTACEVADVFAKRLGLDEPVLTSLGFSFERWNGRGLPTGAKATAIARPMRVAQLSHEFEVLARIEGVTRALEIVRARRGKAYDPFLTDLAVERGAGWWVDVEPADPWDEALALAPACAPLGDEAVREALLVLADFADLKSPWTSGHSRAVAALALEACGPRAEAAALVHDLGRVAVPNSIWDRPGPLTRDERDRAESHALVTDQLLRRVPYTAGLAGAACSSHERVDGSGYHRRINGAHLDEAQRVIAAADCYQAMTSDRPYRGRRPTADAAAEMRAMSAAGNLDGEAVERVLAAAGHRRVARSPLPAGLTAREAEVLRLLALGLTIRQVADRLVITAKTADHHVQHIYTKIGVSTRGAATLFAIEHGILTADP